MDYQKLADLLFPHITKTPEEVESSYPARDLVDGAPVTRLGPSPTGFIHLGNLYGAFVDERVSHLNGGTFFLRIEDTDDKRFVEGAAKTVIESLQYFGIDFDEGATIESDKIVTDALAAAGGKAVESDTNTAKGDGPASDDIRVNTADTGTPAGVGQVATPPVADPAALAAAENGSYGPYHQSQRAEIYQTFAKKLVAEGKAYPCFLTTEEIAAIREEQEKNKLTPGIYGKFAVCRDLTVEEVEAKLVAKESFVIRLHSKGDPDNLEDIHVADAIRGELTMPENFQDTVIIKATGLPTYHFAHVVDDHLMKTTHVVRGEEWLSSLPVHYELFTALGWDLPLFCHTAVLMKVDEETGNKRKLSKRKDPELALDYYKELGYHPLAVREYLLTIMNSDYEEWRKENPDTPCDEFPFALDKLGISGALFDMNKLNDVSKDVLVKIPAAELYDFLTNWAEAYKPEVMPLLSDRAYIEKILDLGRDGNKPRKDFIRAGQMFDFISYFFDDYFKMEDELPAEAQGADAAAILEGYLATYDHGDTQEEWFEKIRTMATELGYAAKPKDYKKNPDDYKGHVGHVSGVIRLAIVGRASSPDVWEIQQILGEEKARARIEAMIASLA